MTVRPFFVLVFSVLICQNTAIYAQTPQGQQGVAGNPEGSGNANAAAGKVGGGANGPNRKTRVSNFPERSEVQAGWEAVEGKNTVGVPDDPTLTSGNAGKRPATRSSGAGGAAGTGGGRITASPLPDPNVEVNEALDMVMPMNVEQTKKFSREVYARSRAMSELPGGPYTRRGPRLIRVNLSPGAPIEKISAAMGYGVKVAVIDSTGAPVTVDSVESYSTVFNVQVMDTEEAVKNGASFFSIVPKTLTGKGGASFQVPGMMPVVFDVEVGLSPVVDSVIQFVVPVMSNSRTAQPGERMGDETASILPEMQGFLVGIAPQGAVEVPVTRVSNVTAWMWKNRLYLRTSNTIFTPAYYRRQGSADGTAVYELPLSPIVSMGVNGKEVQAILEFPVIPGGIASMTSNKSTARK
jgi:intracellular multiplication protein IcmK